MAEMLKCVSVFSFALFFGLREKYIPFYEERGNKSSAFGGTSILSFVLWKGGSLLCWSAIFKPT